MLVECALLIRGRIYFIASRKEMYLVSKSQNISQPVRFYGKRSHLQSYRIFCILSTERGGITEHSEGLTVFKLLLGKDEMCMYHSSLPFTWAPHNILMRKTHTHGIDSIRGGSSHIYLVLPQGKASNSLERFCAGEKNIDFVGGKVWVIYKWVYRGLSKTDFLVY